MEQNNAVSRPQLQIRIEDLFARKIIVVGRLKHPLGTPLLATMSYKKNAQNGDEEIEILVDTENTKANFVSKTKSIDEIRHISIKGESLESLNQRKVIVCEGAYLIPPLSPVQFLEVSEGRVGCEYRPFASVVDYGLAISSGVKLPKIENESPQAISRIEGPKLIFEQDFISSNIEVIFSDQLPIDHVRRGMISYEMQTALIRIQQAGVSREAKQCEVVFNSPEIRKQFFEEISKNRQFEVAYVENAWWPGFRYVDGSLSPESFTSVPILIDGTAEPTAGKTSEQSDTP